MAAKEKKTPVARDDSAMAELSRRFRANPFVFIGTVVILVLTIVTFILVPALAPTGGSGGGKLTFGYYDGKPIDFVPGNYFAQQRDYYNQQLRSQNQDVQTAAFQIWRAAFDATVVRQASLSQVKEAGFVAPKEIVDRRMAEYPAFQENGRFSAAKYRAMGEADRTALRAALTDEIAMERYFDDVQGLRTSTKEKDFVRSMASPERSFELVAFPLSSYPDSEVSSFVAANPDLFAGIELSAVSVETTEADAKKILDQVKGGKLAFEEAAKAQSKDGYAAEGGSMGRKAAFELISIIPDEAARKGVMALAAGEYSGVVKTSVGWSFFRCDQGAAPADASDAGFIAKARTYMRNFERGRMEDYLVARAASFKEKAATAGMDAAAAEFAVEKKSFGPTPLNYGDFELFRDLASFQLPELSGASTNEAFLKAAFSTPVAGIADPVVVGERVLVLKVLEQRAAEDSSSSIIDFYYPYLVSQLSERALKDSVLKSDKLDDRFIQTFIDNFMPKQ